MAWYNQYRPQKFEDVVGQNLVKQVLQNALEKNIIKHAYLFSGSRGVGKTTLARIFANELNQISQNPEARIDIVEMDAASNTGIDDIRQLKDSSQTPPISGKYKIFIIDEVHMLSKAAMNALLKTLEEPPKYLIFLLATTNPEKLLPTVLSRLTKLTLTNHSIKDIVSRLDYITQKEGVSFDQKSLELIAKRGQGSQRDSINFLETVASYGFDKYNQELTAKLLGMLPDDILEETAIWLLAIHSKDERADKILINLLPKLEDIGVDGEGFLAQLLEFLLDQSLSGQQQYDQLITPLAKILDWKLPLTEVVQVVALIQAEIRKGKGNINTDLVSDYFDKQTPQTTKKKVEKVEESFNKIDDKTTDFVDNHIKSDSGYFGVDSLEKDNPSLQENSEKERKEEAESNEIEENNPAKKENSQTVEKEDIVNYSTSLKNSDSNYPKNLKMIMDLGFEFDEKEQKLILSVTSGLFQAALKSQKVRDYFEEKIKEKFDINIIVDNRIRTSKEVVAMSAGANSQTKTDTQSNQKRQNPSFSEVINKEATAKPSFANEPKEGEIFYKVYKKLPNDNLSEKGVKVYDKNIPEPTKTQESEKSWDDHLDDHFEFE